MKKTKKCDLKKLALIGIAGGIGFATEVPATDLNNVSELLAFNACGGAHGCHGGNQGVGANNNGGYYQAYRNTPSQDTYYPSQDQTPSNLQNTPSSQYPQYAGCQSSALPQGRYYQSSQPSQGCSASAVADGQMAPQPARSPQGQPRNSQQPSSSSPNQPTAYTQWETNRYTADTAKISTQRSLTESELLSQLNDQAKASYQSLDPAGKALALKLANQDCKGQNECKGMNSCKTQEHACAGKGSCAGTASSNFKDKNLAIKIAALKMSEKRANAASSKY